MLRIKLKATTLVETLAASIIVAIAFGIGTMIYLNVLNSGKSMLTVQAEILVQNELENTLVNRQFEKQEINKDDITLKKSIENYIFTDLYIIHVKAFHNNKELAEVKSLVFIK